MIYIHEFMHKRFFLGGGGGGSAGRGSGEEELVHLCLDESWRENGKMRHVGLSGGSWVVCWS